MKDGVVAGDVFAGKVSGKRLKAFIFVVRKNRGVTMALY